MSDLFMRVFAVLPIRAKLGLVAVVLFAYGVVGWAIYSEVAHAQVKVPDQAIAPATILAKQINELAENESGYTMQPEAFIVGLDGKCWLDGNAPISSTQTLIKVNKTKSEYHVTIIQHPDVKWMKTKIEANKGLVPVKTLVVLPQEKAEKK